MAENVHRPMATAKSAILLRVTGYWSRVSPYQRSDRAEYRLTGTGSEVSIERRHQRMAVLMNARSGVFHRSSMERSAPIITLSWPRMERPDNGAPAKPLH